MKKFFLLLSLTLLMISCKPEPEPQVQIQPEAQIENIRVNSLGSFPYNSINDEIIIQEIDGCQYLVLNGRTNEQPAITHKGNCKYCEMRAQTLLAQAIKDTIK